MTRCRRAEIVWRFRIVAFTALPGCRYLATSGHFSARVLSIFQPDDDISIRPCVFKPPLDCFHQRLGRSAATLDRQVRARDRDAGTIRQLRKKSPLYVGEVMYIHGIHSNRIFDPTVSNLTTAISNRGANSETAHDSQSAYWLLQRQTYTDTSKWASVALLVCSRVGEL